MAPRKVYEGKAELNIQEWLDSLKKLEDSTGATADNLGKVFQRLQQTIAQTTQAVQQGVSSAVQQVNSIGSILSGSNQALSQSSAAAKQASGEAKKASDAIGAQSKSAKEGTDAALRLAQAQARGAVAARDYAEAEKILSAALASHTGSALAQQNAVNQLAALKARAAVGETRAAAASEAAAKREAAALLKKAEAAAQVSSSTVSREAQRQAQLSEAQTRLAAAQRTKDHQDEVRQLQERLVAFRNSVAEEARIRRYATTESLTAQKARYQQELRELSVYLQEVVARRAQAEAQAVDSQRRSVRTPEEATSVAAAYRQHTQEAQRAAQVEMQLRRQVAEVERSVTSTSLEETRRRYGSLQVYAAQAANEQAQGWERINTSLNLARERLQAVEDKFNSVYRAGSQITQLGSMMLGFTQRIAGIGAGLVENAGDFDLWAARGLAAVRAANDAVGVGLAPSIDTLDEFRTVVMETGRAIGVLAPDQVAETWFKYQAALGGAIETEEQLQVAMRNTETAMKVSVATNTEATTVIDGTAAVLAQFKMGMADFDYVSATLSNIGQITQASFGDVAQSFKYVGPFAERIGMNFGQVAANLVLLAENGVKGSQAGRLMSSWIVNLIKPSEQLDGALKELFKTGENGDWRDLVFTNGEFDLIKFLDNYTGALEDAPPALREFFNAHLAGKEAIKVFGTLADSYDTNQQRYKELVDYFNNSEAQVNAFGEQWEQVAESTAVQWGVVTYALDELKVRLGTILAANLIPLMKTVGDLAQGFLDWAETHPETADGLTKVAIAVTALLGAGGAFLVLVGSIAQGIAGLPIILTALKEGFGLLRGNVGGAITAFRALGPALFGMNLPILALVAAVGLLGAAWFYNVGGIRDSVAALGPLVAQEFGAIIQLFGGLATVITGFASGNPEVLAQGGQDMAEALITALYVIPDEIANILNATVAGMGRWFEDLIVGMGVWGQNLVTSLANGMADAAAGTLSAVVTGIAEMIAQYFRSYSPPRYGPLRGIQVWGRNLIHTLVDGMNEADISAVSEVADRLGVAIRRNVEDGLTSADGYAAAVGGANDLIADMLTLVRGGGRASETFFDSLMPQLGEWHAYIVEIALAYQEVYANERQLKIEQDKLDAIKGQREEIERANTARQDAFDDAYAGTNAGNYQADTSAAIDPLSAEGKAKIAEMRRTLSQEEFGNWISYQKRLWDQKKELEDRNLASQEEAIESQVETLEKQLEAAKTQYDYYVKMYEYAVKMYDLAKEEEQLAKKETASGGGGGAGPVQGSPQDLSAFIAAIRKLIGEDQAILDEGALASNRGGDDVGAVGDAERQRTREEERLKALEAENRRRRAQAEVDLINATSDEERKRIKDQADAWDAAYRTEKTRLQERVSLAKEVSKAAEERADASQPERTAAIEAAYQEEIKGLLGEQTGQIEDANQLKSEAGSLDKAAIEARGQLRVEERKLRDLQQFGDQRKLDFERRIREAANDPERIRRIEEEQEAWEAAYKVALEAQQARVELARRAQQDIGDEQTAAREEKAAAGGGSGVPNFGGGGIPGLDDIIEDSFSGLDWGNIFGIEKNEQVTSRTQTVMADLQRAIAFLGDETIPAMDKLKLLGGSIGEAFGWTSWEDFLGLDSFTIEEGSFAATIAQILAPLSNGLDALNVFADNADLRIAQWAQDTDTRFNNWATTTLASLGTWDTETSAKISNWVTTKIADIGRWDTETSAKISTWVTNTIASIGTWDTETSAKVSTWVTNRIADIGRWDTETSAKVSTWVTNTIASIGTWDTETSAKISNWVTTKIADIGRWDTETSTTISTWVSTRITEAGTWATETGSKFSTWYADTKAKVFDWADGALSRLSSIFDPVRSFISSLASIRFPSMPDWLGGGGEQKGGGGGGSYAQGLERVPYDLFPAYLHQGERVLTAAEAAQYNAFEAALGKGSFGAAAGQQAGGSNTSSSRSMTVNVGRIDASNPDQGRALLSQLAFLS